MNKKELVAVAIIYTLIQFLLSSGMFVTPNQMEAYAVSKDTMQLVLDGITGTNKRLDNIETKLDNLAEKQR